MRRLRHQRAGNFAPLIILLTIVAAPPVARAQGVDSDGDGLSDDAELLLGTDPRDADSDDDGIGDGEEGIADSDGDGLVDALDADSDDDGLLDGVERGLTEPLEATDLSRGRFRPDADPQVTTDPTDPDSDDDGVRDGAEDPNHDGRIDESEAAGTPGLLDDADGDGLTDREEQALGSAPDDADSDDDGVPDGAEPNWALDEDGDGLPNLLDPDSDDDGILDGTELGVTAAAPSTDTSAGSFRPDLDPATHTNPLLRDSDGGGASDGSEDSDLDGRVGPGEGDPLAPADDGAILTADGDGDGLSDRLEARLGTDPNDADSDDDGLPDGSESNPSLDTDGDGKPNPLDPDADADGLADGTERGRTVAHTQTAAAPYLFVPDADPSTRTGVLSRDSDGGGVPDGLEDLNRNGRVDPGESDPLNGADDQQPDPDLDGDGLPNDSELALGTLAAVPDSDGDTLSDGVEAGDPAAPFDTDGDGVIDALDTDSDGDTLGDAEEAGDADLSTPPRDTDGDGLPDYRDLDSDGDGLLDEEEVAEHRTDPRLADTDGGGAGDGLEVLLFGTDPLDPEDDFLGVLEPRAHVQGGLSCDSSPGTGPSSSGAGANASLLLALGVLALLLLRRPGGGAACVALAVLGSLAGGRAARASEGFDPGGPHLSRDGTGIWATESGRSLYHLQLSGGVVGQGSERLVSVVVKDEEVRRLLARRVRMDLFAAVGLFGLGELRVLLPYTVFQEGEAAGQRLGSVASQGVGDLELSLKVQLPKEWLGAVDLALVGEVGLPTGEAQDYLGSGDLSGGGFVALSWGSGSWLLAVNGGLRFLPDRRVHTLQVVDRFFLRGGVRWRPFASRFGAALEVQGELPLRDWPLVQSQRNGEATAGVSVEVFPGARLDVGGAAGFLPGYRTARFRWFTGLSYRTGLHAPGDADGDGDGIADAEDLCASEPEDLDAYQDGDGCPDPDNDGDGIPDVADRCPNLSEDFNGLDDTDGCPEEDRDGDGLSDDRDRCPDDPEDPDGFEDGDGCPEPDNDADGIDDQRDRCPMAPETRNGMLDADGCPDRILARVTPDGRKLSLVEPIRFRLRRSTLLPSSLPVLDQVAVVLRGKWPGWTVRIHVKIEEVSDPGRGLDLSAERARGIFRYLVQRGVDPDQIHPAPRGAAAASSPPGRPGTAYRTGNVDFELVPVE